MNTQSHRFFCYDFSTTEKHNSYILKAKSNKSLFVQAVKYSDLKRKEMYGDDQIQSEMDLLREFMLNRRKSSYKLNWNNSITNFERYEQLKRENQEVFKRKAAMNSKKDLRLPRMQKYLLNIKKIISPTKEFNNNLIELNKYNISLAKTPFNKSSNNNQMIIKGIKISSQKNSSLDMFLETKASFNLSFIKKNKIHYSNKYN